MKPSEGEFRPGEKNTDIKDSAIVAGRQAESGKKGQGDESNGC